jgi:hypothetical protein
MVAFLAWIYLVLKKLSEINIFCISWQNWLYPITGRSDTDLFGGGEDVFYEYLKLSIHEFLQKKLCINIDTF